MFISALAASCMMIASCNQTAENTTNTENNDATTTENQLEYTGGIVYIDLDQIIAEYDMANDLRTVVESKVQGITNDVNRRRNKLEKEAKTFQEKMDKGLMTRSTAEVQAQKLQKQEQDFNNYAAKKQQEIMEEQQVMMNQIADAIQTYIQEYNETAGYTMILTNQGGVPVIAADPSLNITEEILSGLNEAYVKTKNEK